MNAHGYILKGNSATASPDYIPSMIGIIAGTLNPTNRDPYFERIDIADRTVTSLAYSRWTVYDDKADANTIDPIMEVKAPRFSYYIPYSELFEIAAFNHDDDTIELLETLRKARRQ